MKSVIKRIDEHLMVQMRVFIRKQWKVPKKREWGLKKLGGNPRIAHKQSHIKGYMKAVRLPQIKKAISKGKLTKRGLVSPLDYYLRQHTLKLN